MTYPDHATAATLRLYDRLPEHYRNADAADGTYPLLRYLSLLLDQLEPVDQLAERIDYDRDAGDTGSDLVDAATANGRWLPWLAQLLGVRIADRTVAEQRAALADPVAEWAHGSYAALAEAAQVGLTGTKDVTVTPHYDGDPWLIGIGTLDSETPTIDTWAELEAVAPTWADLEALGSFATDKASPSVTAERERPAGYTLVAYSTGP